MLTVGITTFKHRFEKYFKPLMDNIKLFCPDVEVIVAINGEHKETFDENYRKEMLTYLSQKKNTFPLVYPEFRSLSKLWNNILVHSSNEHVLVLNDDISIEDSSFFDILMQNLKPNSFKINGSWSHIMLNRNQIERMGWFDERLLGIGEEDGDMEWRLFSCNENFENIHINGIHSNNIDPHKPTNIKSQESKKYSVFNQNFFYLEKMLVDEQNGKRCGICPALLVQKDPCVNQYPYESFYWKRKNEL